jgi:ABC-type antimicrobial peptide transport system permease subunit
MFNLLKWIGYSFLIILLLMVGSVVYFGIKSYGEHETLYSIKAQKNVRIDTVYVEKVIHDTVIIYQKPKEIIQPVQTIQQPIQTQNIDTIKSNESKL